MRVARMVAEELRRLLAFRRSQHPLPEQYGLAWVVTRPRHVDEADVIRLGLLRTAELERRPRSEQGHYADVLLGREGNAAGDDRRSDLGQMHPLDLLGAVLGGRVRHLVA